MKKILRILLLMCVFVGSSFLFTGCDDDLILVTGVDLYTEEIYADVNESVDLSYKIYPRNATNQKVTFWSTDESIASVDENGKVTMKSPGEASIVVRSVDGGYEDYCKIVTNIDPDEIAWELNDKVTEETNPNTAYTATASMALNQVMKLKLNYLINDEISEKVTNKNVKFTSSNSSNIQVINESEGIIKAFNNEIIEGERAFSDITATLETGDGTLSVTCRVYINEYASLNNLYVNYLNGNMEVLNQRNGSETIYLTSGGDSVEFYTYLTNMSSVVKTDYDITIESRNNSLFEVELMSSTSDGIHKFRLTPLENEGTGELSIKTSCSDENGRAIRCNINVTIQAEITSAVATATERKEGAFEVLLNGEIFNFDMTFFDHLGNKIEGAQRNIYFEMKDDLSEYVTYYGNNQFKVTKVPENPSKLFRLTIYFYVENVETSARIDYEYVFYLRNSLESLIVSQTEKTGQIPNIGVRSITLPVGEATTLYAYATTYNFMLTEPANVNVSVDDANLLMISGGSGSEFLITANDTRQGVAVLTFKATDGIVTIEYEVVVYIVATIAEIQFYTDCNAAGLLSNQIADRYIATGDSLTIYVDIVPTSSEFEIECDSSIALKATNATVYEKLSSSNTKVVKYIIVDLSSLQAGDTIKVDLYAERILNSASIVIEKA